MRRSLLALVTGWAGTAWSQSAQVAQPPPDFGGMYQIPQMTTPPPRADIFGVIDVLVLALGLALTAWIVHRRRSRKELYVVALFGALYFGFYRLGCVCAVGSIQNVALALGDPTYRLPWTVAAFFALPLVAALFWGRVFCAGVCPLGAIQELVLLKPLRVPSWLDSGLGLLPYIYLGVGVLFAYTGAAFFICEYDPFIGIYRLSAPYTMVFVSLGFLLLSVFVGRPYCRWLCPYGVLLRWCAPFAKKQVRITPSECVMCHLCASSCPYEAIKAPTPTGKTPDFVRLRRMATGAVLLLVLGIPLFGWLGWLAGPALSREHYAVITAEEMLLVEQGQEPGNLAESFLQTGQDPGIAYAEAMRVVERFQYGGALLGAWIALVAGLMLLLELRKAKRKEYEADPGGCYACARCFPACPVGKDRLIHLEVLK